MPKVELNSTLLKLMTVEMSYLFIILNNYKMKEKLSTDLWTSFCKIPTHPQMHTHKYRSQAVFVIFIQCHVFYFPINHKLIVSWKLKQNLKEFIVEIYCRYILCRMQLCFLSIVFYFLKLKDSFGEELLLAHSTQDIHFNSVLLFMWLGHKNTKLAGKKSCCIYNQGNLTLNF